MQIQNLHFFDKNGYPLNFEQVTEGSSTYIKGAVNFQPLSIALFDNQNFYVLEKPLASYEITFVAGDWVPVSTTTVALTIPNTDYNELTADYIVGVYNSLDELVRQAIDDTGQAVTVQKTETEIIITLIATAGFDGKVIVTDDRYFFPQLDANTALLFKWRGQDDTNIFLYDVRVDPISHLPYINKVDGIDIASYDEIKDLRYPLEFNVGFNPADEIAYNKELEIWLYDENAVDSIMVGLLSFYGEGISEDGRFADWLGNFGVKFNRNDALIIKDYDVKEAMPDWKIINNVRKQLLVNREEIFPYIGTYRGLANIIGVLGFRDILHVKEYWQNVDQTDPYFDKYLTVDISDMLDDGKIDNMNLANLNRNIKFNNAFQKTGFIALSYEFTRESGTYDSDGIPIIEETTEFTPDEIFFKLNKLKTLLMNEYLPVNVVIKDIIGEFLYVEKIVLKFWPDATTNFEAALNETIDVIVNPGYDLHMVDISTLYRKKNDSAYPMLTYNESGIDPYENNQKYNKDEITAFSTAIMDFYQARLDVKYRNPDCNIPWEFGDSFNMEIGCPVVLQFAIAKFKISDLAGMRWVDFMPLGSPGGQPYYTWANLNYRNLYEIEWIIEKPAPNAYSFSMRGKIADLNTIPHILPYIGEYTVKIKAYDFFGGASMRISQHKLKVTETKPQLVGISRIPDKYSQKLSDLQNIKLGDLDGPLYNPTVNIIYNRNENTNIKSKLFDWNEYSKTMYNVKIWDDANEWEDYDTSINQLKQQWGTNKNMTLSLADFGEARIKDLFFVRASACVYNDDYLAGFYFRNPRPGDIIRFAPLTAIYGIYPDYIIPDVPIDIDVTNVTWLEWLALQMNESLNPAVSMFKYRASVKRQYNELTSEFDIVDIAIHAQAVEFNKLSYMTLEFIDNSNGSPSIGINGDKYTYSEPYWAYSKTRMDDIEYLPGSPQVQRYANFDRQNLLTLAPYKDIFDGKMGDNNGNYGMNYWIDKGYINYVNGEYIGNIPSVIDENAFQPSMIKFYNGAADVPRYSIIFFSINNIPSKYEVLWTLFDSYGNIIIRTRDVQFFAWKFQDLGSYTLQADITDTKGNEYSQNVVNIVNVLPFDKYKRMIEGKLDDMKILDLLANGHENIQQHL